MGPPCCPLVVHNTLKESGIFSEWGDRNFSRSQYGSQDLYVPVQKHSQRRWEAAPQRPGAFVASDLHKSILHRERGDLMMLRNGRCVCVGGQTHQSATEVCLCVIPSGTTVALLTHVDVIQ